MFLTTARGTHIHRPAQAHAPAFNEPNDLDALEEGSMTMVQALGVGELADRSGRIAGGSATAKTVAEDTAIGDIAALMDVDKAVPEVAITTVMTTNPTSVSGNSGKRTHSETAMSQISDETSITTPILSDPPSRSAKKANRGKGASRSQPRTNPPSLSHGSLAPSSSSTKISPASAMVGMQAQIGRLTDVFVESMKKPGDNIASIRSQAITRIQDIDDGLSLSDKVKMIGLFQKDAQGIIAQTYLDLVDDEIRRAWLLSTLEEN